MDVCVSSKSNALPRKQTRSNVQQSKHGCFTCRCLHARRVKCDEARPSCNRCVHTNRACEGYRWQDAISQARHPAETADCCDSGRYIRGPSGMTISKFFSDASTIQSSQIGIQVLGQSEYNDPSAAHSNAWNKLVPKLCRANRSLFAATAALGAAYQAYSSSGSFQGSRYLSVSLPYDMALASLHKDLSSAHEQKYEDAVATFLACIVLAGSEALQRNLTNALTHVRGALRLYNEYLLNHKQSVNAGGRAPKSDDEKAALDVLAKEVDMQTVTYMLSIPLEVPALPLVAFAKPNHTRAEALNESRIVSIIHASYAFCSNAVKHKYRPQALIPTDVFTRQDGWITLLRQCLARCQSQYQLEMLRTRCLSAIIYTSSILSPHESTFDLMFSYFQEIVDAAAAALLIENSHEVADIRPRFRRISTLCQPLFLTAMKCRDRHLRRKAIELLVMTGKEGPWDSRILVAVANKAVEIEEQYAVPLSSFEHQFAIPERARLHSCGMGHMTKDSGSPVDGMIPQRHKDLSRTGTEAECRVIEFRFWRCTNIKSLIQADRDGDALEIDDEAHWETWIETIKI